MGANAVNQIPNAPAPHLAPPANVMERPIDLLAGARDDEFLTPILSAPRPLPSSLGNSQSRLSHDMMTLPPPTE